MRIDTQNWIESAKYDLETADYMLTTERFLYVIFLCHLAIEKMLKAMVTEVHEKPAPRSHDLIYLLKRANLKPETEVHEFISKLNNASILTRYPSDMQKTISEYSKQVAVAYLGRTQEVIRWLKSQPKLQE